MGEVSASPVDWFAQHPLPFATPRRRVRQGTLKQMWRALADRRPNRLGSYDDARDHAAHYRRCDTIQLIYKGTYRLVQEVKWRGYVLSFFYCFMRFLFVSLPLIRCPPRCPPLCRFLFPLISFFFFTPRVSAASCFVLLLAPPAPLPPFPLIAFFCLRRQP